MVDIIEGIIYPLSITVFFFGPGIFRYPLHNSRLYLNLFSALFLWSAYVYGFYYVVISWPEILGDFINSFAVIMSLIVTIMSIIITFHKKKNFRMCIRKLILVDDTLEKLGTPKEYHKIRNSIKQMLIIWFMMICVTLTSDSLLCIEVFKDIKAMLIPLFMDYCLWINTFMDIIFMVLLRFVNLTLLHLQLVMSMVTEVFLTFYIRNDIDILKAPHSELNPDLARQNYFMGSTEAK
ncbi:uncharacterized protein LOC105276033 isoform X1 [Ooceraea biroi]|uniref:uncharacterized protein LOC105276033 isoform X1 n=1 Tax=Ooceraea biroi TaxID=2015173 RepID=UPI000F073883|nr:uncharacterized protein LOC105276033 isoform X1 [Ooceraea biroi]